MSFGEQMMT